MVEPAALGVECAYGRVVEPTTLGVECAYGGVVEPTELCEGDVETFDRDGGLDVLGR